LLGHGYNFWQGERTKNRSQRKTVMKIKLNRINRPTLVKLKCVTSKKHLFTTPFFRNDPSKNAQLIDCHFKTTRGTSPFETPDLVCPARKGKKFGQTKIFSNFSLQRRGSFFYLVG
jgi:hypothetical protein